MAEEEDVHLGFSATTTATLWAEDAEEEQLADLRACNQLSDLERRPD